MKKKFSAVNILLLVLFLICGCSAAEKGNVSSNDTQPSVETWATEHGLRQMASAVTDKLTLEEKIGQMMFVGIHGTTLTETTKNTLSSMHAGGVILFDRNMENREQVKALNASLRNLVLNKYALPLFLSVDQEGGLVTRMKQHAYTAPAAAEIGAAGKPEDAYNHANNTGKDIHELGFNLDFAPVLDISSRMHGRSYGTTPQQVTAFGEQACRGLRDSGVLFTVKHFPGMGRSETDPHTDQSVVNVPRQTILQEDLLPFRNIIDQYPHHEFMVMAPEEIGIIAVQAGTDILLSCHKPEVQQRIYRSTLQAVKDGKISQKDIDASVRRIVYCKLKKLMDNDQRKNCFNRLSGNANVSQHYSPQQPLWSGRSTVRLTPEIQDGKAS